MTRALGCVSLRKSKIGFLNPKTDFGFLWCIKETEESLLRPVPLHHDPSDLGLICLEKKR